MVLTLPNFYVAQYHTSCDNISMRSPKNALRYRLGAGASIAAEIGRRRAEYEAERLLRGQRKANRLSRHGEPLPRVTWRSPHFPLFPDIEERAPRGPKNAPLFGNTSIFKSHKMADRYIICTSEPELHLAYHLEFDDAVEWYVEQPFAVRYRCGDRVAWHVPDMFAMRAGRGVVIQAKTVAGAAADNWREREPHIRAALEELGFAFELLTNLDLGTQPKLRNIRRRIDDRLRPAPAAEHVREYLAAHGPQVLWIVTEALGLTIFDLRVMVAHRLLYADINSDFDDEVILSC
jgi:hypothetical protein